jgi:hypothetical protein
MADNVELNLGSGGKVVRSIDKGGFEAQVVIVDLGGAGAESLLTGAMPVTGTFWQATQPVSGAVSVSNFPAGFLAAQSGTWNVGITGTVPVSGTFWQATQPVSVATLPALAAGTANIGDVDVLTLPSLPAGTNLIGKTSTAQDTDALYSGTTSLTPKFVTYSTSSSGDLNVVAAVTSKRIRVLRWRTTSNGATNIKWKNTGGADVSGLSYLTQFKDVGGGYCPVGHFQTTSGVGLDINNSAAIAISGEITYIEV